LPYADQVFFVRRLRFEKSVHQCMGLRRVVPVTLQIGDDVPLPLNNFVPFGDIRRNSSKS
jgi:hypothetical protein